MNKPPINLPSKRKAQTYMLRNTRFSVFGAMLITSGLLATACGSDSKSTSPTTAAAAPSTEAAPSSAPSTEAAPSTVPATDAAPTTADVSKVGAGKTIKVGGIFARTVTPNLDLGAYEAVDSYFKEINAKGGINGYMFSFEGIDDQGDPAKFAAAMERLVGSGVDFIVSSSQSEVTGGLPQIESSGIPYIGGASYSRDALTTIPNLFPIGANAAPGVNKAIETILTSKTPAITKASISHVNHPVMTEPVKVMVTNLTADGINVVDTGTFELTETDFTGVAAKILNADVKDAVLFNLTSQLPGIVGALQQQGYQGSIYGGSYSANLPEKLGAYANGRYFSVQPVGAIGSGAAGDSAEATVKKSYPDVDLKSDKTAMQTWSAAELVVETVKRLGATPITKDASVDVLNTLTDYATTFSPPITYKAIPDGHLDVSHCLQTLKIDGGQWALSGPDRWTCWTGSTAPAS
jgi:ABC-type branched-subunit amino acid transport system substrate-binding protein